MASCRLIPVPGLSFPENRVHDFSNFLKTASMEYAAQQPGSSRS
jgi:hypothetical protein